MAGFFIIKGEMMLDNNKTKKEGKEYSAFGVTGGIVAMIGVFFIKLFGNGLFWLNLWNNFFKK